MHSRTSGISRGALITLSACALSLGAVGCGTKQTKSEALERYSAELREAVSTKVPDEGRKTQMLSIVDELGALHRRFSQETTDFLESYGKLNAGYDAARPAFDQLFSDYNAKRIRARSEALDLHFRLAALATAHEWDAIGKAEVELYEEINAANPSEKPK